VKRYESIIVAGVNREGRPVKLEAEGMLAIILQHEIDHLNGKLFIDHISALKRQLYTRRMKKKLRSK
jgi:peptide deformylase